MCLNHSVRISCLEVHETEIRSVVGLGLSNLDFHGTCFWMQNHLQSKNELHLRMIYNPLAVLWLKVQWWTLKATIYSAKIPFCITLTTYCSFILVTHYIYTLFTLLQQCKESTQKLEPSCSSYRGNVIFIMNFYSSSMLTTQKAGLLLDTLFSVVQGTWWLWPHFFWPHFFKVIVIWRRMWLHCI